MNYPFGIDISSWQSYPDRQLWMDISALTRHPEPVQFVFCRATHGMYADKAHAYYTRELDRFGIPNGSYAYMLPAHSARLQTDLFLQIAPPKEHRRHVIDMEAAQGLSRTRITDFLLEVLEIMRERTGRYPMVYSRALWIRDHLQVSRLPKLDYWLAQYLTRRPAPQYTPEFPTDKISIPAGVDRKQVKFHQSGDKANGGKLGSMSYYIDTDRFLGTPEQLRAWFGYGEIKPDPEPEPPAAPAEKLFDAKVTTTPPNRLKTRYTPNGNVRPEADWLQSQAIVPVYETHSTGWWRVADEAWSSATWMQRVDDLPLPPPMSGDYAYYGAVYSQRDVRWKDHPLGTKSTIGANGCLVTCASMVCNYFGHATNPLQLNQWLTDNEGYLDGNLFLWAAIERLYPDMKFDGFVYSPTTAQIRAAIQAGTLPIMFVDFNDSTPLIEMHWVLGIGVTADDVLIADPWTGTIGKLSEMYPKSVIRYGSYRRTL